MFLKSLEMVGFKSFADRTVVEFHKGMTAIVGPNGCGKSNVLDSIRWVLGEQSAKALRGGTMQDVIFGGAEARKPVGMCEVSLTFSECEDRLGSDFHEIRVTRRVFRDGQGEYEINKKPCRLRDIQQLFMDTGIGRTAYSIMEQGKIDTILSSKPEDRRAVFEEAAGITRFKAQRKESMRKLDATESNLLRITDIIKEVNRQIGSLQRQAAKARRYKEASERLRELDTRLSAHQYKELEQAVGESRGKVETLQLELNGLQQTLEEKDGFIRQKRIDLENLEEMVKASEQKRSQLENERSQARQSIDFNRQRIEELQNLISKNQLDIASTEEKIRFQKEQAEQLSRDLETLQGELAARQAGLEQAQSQYTERRRSAEECADQRRQVDGEMLANSRQMESHRSRISALEARHRNHLLRVEKLKEDEQAWGVRHAEIDAELAAAQQALSEKEQLKAQSEEAFTKAQEAFDQARETRRQKRETYQTGESGHTRIAARHQALAQLVESHTGLSDATRRVLEDFRGQGLKGTLSEYIEVRPGYERAIETCLGQAFEALIVENSEVFEQVVSSLFAEGRQGAAILVTPEGMNRSSAACQDRPEAAVHFVTARDEVAAWLAKLLEGWFVVEDAPAALALKHEVAGASVTTKFGEIFHKNGWQQRGAAASANQSILARANELKELATQLEQARVAFESARQEMEQARSDAEQCEARLSEARTRRQEVQSEFASAKYDAELVAKRRSEHDARKEQIERERASLNEQDSSGVEETRHLEQEIERLGEANRNLSAQSEELLQRQSELNRLAEEQSQRVMDTRVGVVSLEQRKKALEDQRSPLDVRLQELEQSLHTRREEISDYEQRITQSREGISASEAKIGESSSQIEKVAEEIRGLSEQRQNVQRELTEYEQSVSHERKRTMELQASCREEEVALAERRMHLDALVQRVQRSYQIEISELAAHHQPQPPQAGEGQEGEAPAPDNWDEIEREVQELRDKIDRMGPVNMEAIEEFEELEQRQQFLINQERDLVEAKQKLVEAIKQINETSKVMFAETFQQIQENFSKTFVDLFGGGRASLMLMDEADPLESGIEVVARPPGKQTRTITLLSGGERTMTAVALLFAIYMVKPSPFCVLDEMDAPLDESNIGRFIQMLQKFVQQSQFVVITHNKRTISAADILYGVTMQEQGVSRIVSVKLTRKEEDPLFSRQSPSQPSQPSQHTPPQEGLSAGIKSEKGGSPPQEEQSSQEEGLSAGMKSEKISSDEEDEGGEEEASSDESQTGILS